jgi:hypothetical protein
MEMPEMIRLWKQVSIRLILSVRLGGVEANLMRCTERSWSWLEAMAQEVNESMSISLLSHGISSCRIFFICQSSTHTAWLRLLYGSLTGFGMGVLVCICTVQIDILAKIAQSVPCFIVLLCMYTEPFKIRLQNWTASTTWPMQALL